MIKTYIRREQSVRALEITQEHTDAPLNTLPAPFLEHFIQRTSRFNPHGDVYELHFRGPSHVRGEAGDYVIEEPDKSGAYVVKRKAFQLIYREAGEDRHSLGRAAFEAYSASKGGKTHDGKPIPPWEDLGGDVRAGWQAAAEGALTQAKVLLNVGLADA